MSQQPLDMKYCVEAFGSDSVDFNTDCIFEALERATSYRCNSPYQSVYVFLRPTYHFVLFYPSSRKFQSMVNHPESAEATKLFGELCGLPFEILSTETPIKEQSLEQISNSI